MADGRVLDGKVALVTGAGRGIGRAIAEGYAAAGAAVVLAARSADEIESVARGIRERGFEALAVPADVTRLEEVVGLMTRVRAAHGGLDLLVCNAGGNSAPGRIDSVEPLAWIAGVHLNLVSAFCCARQALPLLRLRGGGKIVMLGSGMGWRSVPGNSSYCVGKAAVSMLVKALAMELREERISVNELIPGPVDTPATRAEIATGHVSAFGSPGEWLKQPEDVVPLALFLATLPDDGPTAQSWSLMRRER